MARVEKMSMPFRPNLSAMYPPGKETVAKAIFRAKLISPIMNTVPPSSITYSSKKEVGISFVMSIISHVTIRRR
jgi:hypothetical protein